MVRKQVPGWMLALVLALSSWATLAAPSNAGLLPASASTHKLPPGELTLPLVQRILATGDNAGLPFAVVDKRAAVMTLHDAQGRLVGATPVLLGQQPGDGSTADVGWRTQTGQLRPQDRTTPAGRYVSQPGRNLSGEGVVWLDYGKAFAIHRLRPAPAVQQRPLRMASADPRDKRISAGCVVAPEGFYDQVVWPLLGHGRGVVYVMPEELPWQNVWQGLVAPPATPAPAPETKPLLLPVAEQAAL